MLTSAHFASGWRQLRIWLAAPQVAALDSAQIQALCAPDASALNAAQLEALCEQIATCHTPAILLPLAAHKNGYLRAAVLQRWQMQPAACQVAAIVARLNDWVPEVRLQAQLALHAHFSARCFDALLQALPALRHLYQCQRAVHRHLLIEVEQFMLQRQFHAKLRAALTAASTAQARECMRLVAHAQLLPMPDLIAQALASKDRLVAGCAPAWIAQLPLTERRIWLQRGAQSAHRLVRAACWRQLARLSADTKR